MLASSARLRSVAVPSEHGGWSLTLEPALLGLIVAPSAAGFTLAGAALVAFVMRTPLRVLLVDRRRGRDLDRTRAARRVVAVEAVALVAFAIVAWRLAEQAWWPPLVPAALLVAVELSYAVRSRSRRLLPELAGTVGVGATATAIALAGGTEALIAYGLWLVIACRSSSAVFFVRLQLRRAKHQPHRRWVSDVAQAVATTAVVLGVSFDAVAVGGAVAIAALCLAHVLLARRPPPSTAVLGAQQVVFGLTVVLVAGLSTLAP